MPGLPGFPSFLFILGPVQNLHAKILRSIPLLYSYEDLEVSFLNLELFSCWVIFLTVRWAIPAFQRNWQTCLRPQSFLGCSAEGLFLSFFLSRMGGAHFEEQTAASSSSNKKGTPPLRKLPAKTPSFPYPVMRCLTGEELKMRQMRSRMRLQC